MRCSDGISNDDDGFIDCQDNDCLWNANVWVCDRDHDGFSPSEGDCLDHPTLDISLAAGPHITEMCGDGIDNDCDGEAEESSCIRLDLGWRGVNSVLDGDTIDVDGLGSVRLKGIDTPETWEESTGEAECFGLEAKSRLKSMVNDGQVHVVLDPVDYASGFRDLYGRLLAFVDVESGEWVNGTLVEEGYACVWSSFECSRKVTLQSLEDEARSDDSGLWGACGASVCF